MLSSVSPFRIITEFDVCLRFSDANDWPLLHRCEEVMGCENLIIILEGFSESKLRPITSNAQLT